MASASQDQSSSQLRALFEDTRRRLIETGTRNRLVHVNRANTRGNVINIVNERSDDVHAILSSKRLMRFKPIGHDAEAGQNDVRLGSHEEIVFDAGRYQDALLETRMGPDALQKRLLKIAREAKTAEEEQGVNILYLALGFLTWFEDPASEVVREAPLVLLPVELVRNQRTSTYDLRLRDDEIMTNLALRERLQGDFGLKLPELEVDEGWAPTTYYRQIDEVIADRPRWKIDRDGMQLGLFSFSKLLMFLDLDPDAWPEKSLETHDLTRGLLYERFDHEPPLFGPEDRLDERLPPDRIYHVVDADASQAKVIEEARLSRNLVVQGPPGTGKSQTITNIIAAAAQEGKTVLFVAEKMAALSVVHDRLVKHGLRDICLELHSKNVSKKIVLDELRRTLRAGQAAPAMPGPPVHLTEARDQLNAIADALHTNVPGTDATPFEALARQVRHMGRGAPPPTLKVPGMESLPRAAVASILTDIGGYAQLAAEARPSDHPFRGAKRLDLQPVDVQRLKDKLVAAADMASNLCNLVMEIQDDLGWERFDSPDAIEQLAACLSSLTDKPALPGDVLLRLFATRDRVRMRDGLDAGVAWRSGRDEASLDFRDTAFAEPVTALRGPLVAGQTSFFARWGNAYRHASRHLAGLLAGALPKRAADRLTLVDRLAHVQSLRRRLAEDEAFLADQLGPAWRGERTDFDTLLTGSAWAECAIAAGSSAPADRLVTLAEQPHRLKQLRQAMNVAAQNYRSAAAEIEQILGMSAPQGLAEAAAGWRAMASASDRYEQWSRLARLRQRLVSAGLESLASRVDDGELDREAAQAEFDFAQAELIWRRALETVPTLASLVQLDRHGLASLFARLERQRLKDNAAAITAKHLEQLPRGALGEIGVVTGEIGKKTRHMPLRRLFEAAPTALQRIKPVLLMSPLSVAQFLKPGVLSFDLLVIDEASQVRPEDALGAIARARQIVVVGDQKQLPPTSFFDRLVAGDDDADEVDEADETDDLLGNAAKLGELESILTLCEARGLPSRMLEWHYRSRDPSLIRVSNREFYEDRLILPPSPLQHDPAFGLTFTNVPGVYDRGGKRDNRQEGEAVVARVQEHARVHPDKSLGIVTFSSSQRNLITELLEIARRGDAVLDEFLREGRAEDAFVKNIENVQGDERDVILISVGYGPAMPGARLSSMSFGPINGEGGERRLNVLFTRARIRCEIFCSFDPGDIDVSRTAKEGPKILKRFLEFAKTGAILSAVPSGEQAETPFEEDVADVIRSFGYIADPQVGSAGFRIDIGVRHPDRPGTYLLAVECDGSTYHSALWARERDRLRQDVLEHLGWTFHRIWSTDWFYNRVREVTRLREALAEASDKAETGVSVVGANDDSRPRPVDQTTDRPTSIEAAPLTRTMPTYQRYSERVLSSLEPHQVDRGSLASLAAKIIAVEGPICTEEIARRIASAYGRERAGGRILAATREALHRLRRGDEIIVEDDFWCTQTQRSAPPVRDRSQEEGATIRIANISLWEIEAAIRIALADCGQAMDGDLIKAAARLLGFRRVGADVQARLAQGLARVR